MKKSRRKLRCPDLEGLRSELDVLLDAIHDDVLITDGNGTIIKVSKSFERVYGIAEGEILGQTVYEMERQGIFKPSVVAAVLRTKEKITTRQKNNHGRDLVVTATPVKNEQGEILKVVSFTRDLTDYLVLQEQYSALESRIEKYTAELEELRKSSIETDGIVAKAAVTVDILRTIARIAPFDANVLITGESGVGKTLFAKEIHKKSKRSAGPFIEINCGAIPENLLESELFGYERGSFTGAAKEGKLGLIELAQNGTLFLDEIAELSPQMQVKLLKVIQDKTMTRVGGTKSMQVDFRLIAASNRDFTELLMKQRFREDLFYRLNVISIEIPPLRERREDIIPMILSFLEKCNREYGLQKGFSQDAYDALYAYSWPGNARELENTIERLILTCEPDYVSVAQLPLAFIDSTKLKDIVETPMLLDAAITQLERRMVEDAYQKWKTTIGVAKELGISQPTAVRKIQKYCKTKKIMNEFESE